MLAETWDTKHWIYFLAPFALILVAAAVAVLMRKTFCTRYRMAKQFRDDPDIKDWLIVFNWSRKIFYLPMIIASVIACGLMIFLANDAKAPSAEIVGGIWLGIFFLNYLVDEYEINLKVILIFVLFAAVLISWLTLMNWLDPFFESFKHLGVWMNSTGYLLLAIMFALGIVTSWIKGLFYYVAVTPNYMNIQSGPTETGEQVGRENFSTRIDTGDFLERILGFGRIIITFVDHHRPPLVLLVSRIGKKAALIESLRGVMAVDLAPGKRGEDGAA